MNDSLQIDLLPLSELIDFEGTADWRARKAVEFPNDERNADAVKLLNAILEGLPALHGSDLHKRIHRAFDVEDACGTIEHLHQFLREIGFHRFPTSAADALAQIADFIAPREDER